MQIVKMNKYLMDRNVFFAETEPIQIKQTIDVLFALKNVLIVLDLLSA